jgi:hypothetical protein
MGRTLECLLCNAFCEITALPFPLLPKKGKKKRGTDISVAFSKQFRMLKMLETDKKHSCKLLPWSICGIKSFKISAGKNSSQARSGEF